MAVWRIGLVLLPLCVGCQQMRLPTSPDPMTNGATVDVAPLRVVAEDARPADATPSSAPAPVPRTPAPTPTRVTVPAWQQAILEKLIAGVTDQAVRQTRRYPGLVVRFEIEAAGGGAVIEGELRDPHQPRSQIHVLMHYLLAPGALTFPDKATLLSALETAVTYQAEVRLRSGEVACCRTKPAIAVTGRFEAF
jgi:hypothetical protein